MNRQSASPKRIFSRQLMEGVETNAYHLRLSQSLFISVSHKGLGGIGIYFTEQDLAGSALSDFISRFSQEKHQRRMKLVGHPSLIRRTEEILLKAGFQIDASIPTAEEFELIYYPERGRIRLKKEEEHLDGKEVPKRKGKIRVLIIDDSSTIRSLLTRIISSDPELEVVGSVGLPSLVESEIITKKPDVLTMDIEMPEMNGAVLLRTLIPKYHLPAVMISSLKKEEGSLVLLALRNGAVDYIHKPSLEELPEIAPLILEKIKAAATAKVQIHESFQKKSTRPVTLNRALKLDQSKVIFMGASTGGTEALRIVLTGLPSQIPPILIVLHISENFSRAFAERMDSLCLFDVKEAEDRDELRPGLVLIAPGGKHMKVTSRGGRLLVQIDDSLPVNRHKPSVDVLFNSAADELGKDAIAVILTGMGADGAIGLKKMKDTGATTIAQDEKSSMVFGMPNSAIKTGGVDYIESLALISDRLVHLLSMPK
ncbi:MAG: chemotaxis response regulator protein-glutamate methylesterase [Bdellovibrionia bacterium]